MCRVGAMGSIYLLCLTCRLRRLTVWNLIFLGGVILFSNYRVCVDFSGSLYFFLICVPLPFLRGPQGAANGQDSWGFFKNAQGFGRLEAGSRAGFTSSRPPPPWTSVFQFSLFLYKMCGLEKLGLVDQNWLERNFSGFLLRTLVVGRRQHSESIEVALDME